MALRYSMAVDLNRGYRVMDVSKLRRSLHCRCLAKHTKFVQAWCAASSPLCKRCAMELLQASQDKDALKFIKQRGVGMHIWAKGRLEKLSSALAAMRKAAAMKG